MPDQLLRKALEALEAIDKATHSHVDGRDLLAELHPRNTLDIKRRRDARETWFEGDWLSNLWTEVKAARAVIADLRAALSAPAGEADANREEALTQIAQSLNVMLGSAVALVDGMGNVVGYQIKTGALHRILGHMASTDHPVTVPICRTRLVLNHESSPWPLEGTAP
jgi:hypothetical protein